MRVLSVWAVALALLARLAAASVPPPPASDGDRTALWGPLSPGQARVATAQELLQAFLNGTGDISLAGNITVALSDLDAFELPIRIEENATILVHPDPAAGSGLATIDWGKTVNVLSLDPGSTLAFQRIWSRNPGLSTEGHRALRHEVKGSFVWPTVTGDPGHTVVFQDAAIDTDYPGCGPEMVQAEVDRLHEQMGSNESAVYKGGSRAWFDLIQAPVAIYDYVTTLQEGSAEYVVANTTMDCYDSLAQAPAPDPDGDPGTAAAGDSGGQPVWLYAVVATACALGLTLTVAVATYAWRRRQRRQRRVVADAEKGGGGEGCNGGSTGGGSADCPGGTPPPGAATGPASSFAPPAGAATGGSAGSSWHGVHTHASGQGSLDMHASGRQGSSELQKIFMRNRYGSVEGVVLGELLGRGSFGKCYKGRWQGATVAVKVIDHVVNPGETGEPVSREPLLSASLSHPNIISTHHISVMRLSNCNLGIGSAHLDDLTAANGEPCPAAASPGPSSKIGSNGSARLPAAGSGGSGGRRGPASGSGGSGGGSATPPQLPAPPSAQGTSADTALSRHSSLMPEGTIVELVSPDEVLTPGHYETWLVTEYADLGNLDMFISASLPAKAPAAALPGTSSSSSTPFSAAASSRARGQLGSGPATSLLQRDPAERTLCVLRCLLDIATGLEYLHNCCNMVHGDLKPANVLLRSVRNDRRGFVCKLGDFGLSRLLEAGKSHLQTGTIGTASYAAPELLEQGRLSTACDVYSLGMIMWQLVSEGPLHSGCNPLQIMYLVTQKQYRPEAPPPPRCPAPLAELMQRCWAHDPSVRPSAERVVEELRGMLRVHSSGSQQAQQRSPQPRPPPAA